MAKFKISDMYSNEQKEKKYEEHAQLLRGSNIVSQQMEIWSQIYVKKLIDLYVSNEEKEYDDPTKIKGKEFEKLREDLALKISSHKIAAATANEIAKNSMQVSFYKNLEVDTLIAKKWEVFSLKEKLPETSFGSTFIKGIFKILFFGIVFFAAIKILQQ